MIHLIVAIILNFSAVWDSPTSARISWYQTERACLWYRMPGRETTPTFIHCYTNTDDIIVVHLGHNGPLDGTLRPLPGGTYILVTDDGIHYTAQLNPQKTYLPIFRV